MRAINKHIIFLSLWKMDFIYIDDDDNDDTYLQHLFKSNIMKMNNNNENFDEEDNEYVEILPVLIQWLFTMKTKWEHWQLSWLGHVKKLQHEDMFTRTCWMSLESFGALVKLLDRNISCNYSKHGYTSSQEPIKMEITVAIGLHWVLEANILTWRMFMITVLVKYMLTGSASFMLLPHDANCQSFTSQWHLQKFILHKVDSKR